MTKVSPPSSVNGHTQLTEMLCKQSWSPGNIVHILDQQGGMSI